mgnify:FL=1
MANTVNGITFEEFCNGMTAAEAKAKSLNCPYWRPDGCEASNPGSVVCMMCNGEDCIPAEHPWKEEALAFIQSA